MGMAVNKKTPLCNERGSPVDRMQCYLFLLLEALSGLIFAFEEEEALITCDAKLQSPVFHFNEGSGQAVLPPSLYQGEGGLRGIGFR